MARVRQFVSDPLSLLLDCYERFGPVFTLRLANSKAVFMLGPEANHYITVSHASNFTWSDSVLRDFSVVLGEGLFLTDGELHDRARRAMVPAFNRDHVAVSTEVMLAETERALDQLTPGSIVDVYGLTRQLTVRIVMRALLGIDPDAEQTRAAEVAAQLDQVEAFFGTFAMRMVRGPFTPWARLKRAMRELNALIDGEILRRRATGRRGEDILSMLLDATGEDGDVLSDAQIRDQVKTLIFAGQDSTTSTLALMLYELARHPEVAAKLAVEQQAQLGPGGPTSAQLASGELPFLEMVLDETLRRYAPPWLGPRRSLDSFEFGGHTIPARAHVAYSMWASHHLADVFEDPFEFRPERFAPEARAALPRGAFVPFGGGQRTCIGMRFAKVQIRTMATLLTSRFSLSLPDGFELQIGQIPTVSPTGGLPMLLGEPRS
jgi:cytochrome P450